MDKVEESINLREWLGKAQGAVVAAGLAAAASVAEPAYAVRVEEDDEARPASCELKLGKNSVIHVEKVGDRLQDTYLGHNFGVFSMVCIWKVVFPPPSSTFSIFAALWAKDKCTLEIDTLSNGHVLYLVLLFTCHVKTAVLTTPTADIFCACRTNLFWMQSGECDWLRFFSWLGPTKTVNRLHELLNESLKCLEG